jgi:hypothetical protein
MWQEKIPTVNSNPADVTDTVKAVIKLSIFALNELSELAKAQVYETAVIALQRGGDAQLLGNEIKSVLNCEWTKKHINTVAIKILNQGRAAITKERSVQAGIQEAKWLYAGLPCGNDPDVKNSDDCHRVLANQTFKWSVGLIVNGESTWPGLSFGCRCSSRPILPTE